MTNDVRSERSRQALIDAGMEMLAENRNASLSDVAQQAGVGRATLYRHFQTREELVKAIAESSIQSFDEATQDIENVATSWLDAIRLMFDAILPLQRQLSFLMKLDILIEEKDMSDLFNQQQAELLHLMQQCQKEKSVKQDVSPEWLISFMDGLLFAAWKMVSEHDCSVQDAARMAFESFCHGVAKRS